MKKKTRVLLYVRVSSQEQMINGYSIGEQTDRLQQYAAAMDWTVIRTYTDPGYSGATTDRPALQELIRAVRSGNVDKVAVYKLDRLSRSQKDTLYLIEDEFLANGTDFVSMSENFDTSTPFGRAMVGILAVFAQLEREQIRERMLMGRVARAKAGGYHGGSRAPLGYQYIDGQLVVDDFTAMYVRKAFYDFVRGKKLTTICKEFQDAGVTTQFWPNQNVKRMLSNRHYLGEVAFDHQWYPGHHEPIIDPETFDAAARRLEIYKENAESVKGHLLTGLLFCAHCGGRYFFATRHDRGKIRTYYCCYSRAKVVKRLIKDPNCKNKNWRSKDLEELILGEIRKLAVDQDYLNRITQEHEAAPEPDKKAILQAEADALTNKIAHYMDLYALDRLTLADIDRAIAPLTEKRAAIEAQLRNMEPAEESPDLSKQDARLLLDSFGDIIDRGDQDEIRLLLTTLIRKIVIDGEDITIYWRFA